MTQRFAPDTSPKPGGLTGSGAGLELAPFRGLRYDPARVASLACVTAPPYDVIEDDAADALEAASPHNIVRLILPEHGRSDGSNPYAGAARTLGQWRSDGVVVIDDAPSLYVYEQSTSTVVQRGLLGAIGLRSPEDRVILAHEDTMPGPVADRLSLLRATRANLEPIYLLYRGGGAASEIVQSTTDETPVIDEVTADGTRHRLWKIVDPGRISSIAADLAPRQALIADGHHRYATYLAFQQEMRAGGHGLGPWDYGLALLVDIDAFPPVLNPIHRVVHGLRVSDAVEAARGFFSVRPVGAGLENALGALSNAGPRHAFVLAGEEGAYLLEDPSPEFLSAGLRHVKSEGLRQLDATILHSLMCGKLWHIDESVRSISYHHSADAAVRIARKGSGTAVLMNPVRVEDVFAVTRSGVRMPRKSTSFGPKPRTGFVMRLLQIG